MTPTTKPRKADSLLVEAVDEARAVLADALDEDEFGDHLGWVADGERVVTHYFATTHPGYRGWRWAVTVARAPRQKKVTVHELVLLPGDDALVAPAWVPWKDRVEAGDLGAGDLVPVEPDDERLVPGYLVGDDVLDEASARDQREVVREVGLGRTQVLSVVGRDQAADRWYASEHGPEAPIAQRAPGPCGSCGFLVRLAGPLATQFGVCANEASPSDGHAVSYDHGCGAHSDVRPEAPQHQPNNDRPVLDTLTVDEFEGDIEPISD